MAIDQVQESEVSSVNMAKTGSDQVEDVEHNAKPAQFQTDRVLVTDEDVSCPVLNDSGGHCTNYRQTS